MTISFITQQNLSFYAPNLVEVQLDLMAPEAKKYAHRDDSLTSTAMALFREKSDSTTKLAAFSCNELDQAFDIQMKLEDDPNASGILRWFGQFRHFVAYLCYIPNEQMQQALSYIALISSDINQCNDSKQTALHLASSTGNVSIARFLISLGIHIDAKDLKEDTALHYAVLHRELEMIELLLEHQVQRDIQDKEENTALHYAVLQQHTEAVELLLDQQLNAKLKNNEGQTVLHCASLIKNTEIARLLLCKTEVDINAQDNVDKQGQGKYTALHYAVLSDNIELSRLLLTYQADPNIKSQHGETALDLAPTEEMANELRKAGGLYSWELAIWDFIKQIYRLIIQMPVQWTAQLVHRLYQGLAAVTQPTV